MDGGGFAVTAKGAYLAWTADGGIVVRGPQDAAGRKVAAEGGFASLLAVGEKVLAAWESRGAIEMAVVE